MMIESCRHLFVYSAPVGASGWTFAGVLRQSARWVGRAHMPGRLYDLGDDAGMRPPRTDADWVSGDVYSLRDLEGTLALLDAFKGCGPDDPPPFDFERCAQDALLVDGSVLQTWVYLYQEEIGESRLIASGNFFAR